MLVSEVIKKLQELQKEHGDIECRGTESHEYWGTLYRKFYPDMIKYVENTSLSPKRMENTPAIVLSPDY